jgi:hypothetical protein
MQHYQQLDLTIKLNIVYGAQAAEVVALILITAAKAQAADM